jgi:REP element-mobilizing transposase RayT
MGSSYISNHIHVVFSTKNRVRSIKEQMQSKLWAYMAGIAENHGMHALKIGGTDDHVHLLINLGGELGIIKAVQLIKSNSSRWMNEHPGPRFEWQAGYFACSVSRSQVAKVTQYIANQKEHHRKIDSEDEFRVLLKKHGFEYHGD